MKPALLFLVAICAHAADLPAFPGAEGFGAAAKGGRGGRVIFVDNLNDSGPGSLRAAILATGPRIVVFRVGGIIDLKKELRVTEPNITIAGQTAPGDGICLRGFGIGINASDAIVRFLRSRPGEIAGKEVDAMGVGGEARNVILDHCSATWSVDECLSPSGAIANVTVQWCIIAEGLNHSVHKKGNHGYGSLVRAVGGLTMHHNLWAHNNARNPRLGENYGKPPYPLFDIRNNVIYGWGHTASGMTGDHFDANYVANFLAPAPYSSTRGGAIVFTKTANTRYYCEGNALPEGMKLYSDTERVTQMPRAFDTPAVRTTTAAIAFEEVLAAAGATVPVRDAVDARIVRNARTRGGRIVDATKEVGGWPEYRTAKPPLDSDNDGMPDDWERAHGLNPRDASDAAKKMPSGYTAIEEYINSLAVQRTATTASRH